MSAAPSAADAPTPPDPLTLFLESRAHTCNDASQALYAHVIGAFHTWLDGRPISALVVEAYLVQVRRRGGSPAYLNTIYRQLKTCCRFLFARGLIDADPFVGPGKVRPPRVPKAPHSAWTDAQIVALLRASGPLAWKRAPRRTLRTRWQDDGPLRREAEQARALVLLLVDTALRAAEACSLNCGDVRSEVLWVTGKGGDRERVFISPDVLARCRELAADRADDAPLLRGWTGERATPDVLRGIVARLCERAGIPPADIPHRPIHAFRHAAAQRWAAQGLNDLTIQRLMRHDSLSTTQIYTAGTREETIATLHARVSPVAAWLAAADQEEMS